METSNVTLSKIEDFLHSAIRGVVSNNVFAGDLPDTIKSTWEDMVVIDCGPSINDMGAYCTGRVLIWLYSKPFSDGRKNVARMERLEAALNEVIRSSSTDTYRIAKDSTYSDYDSTRKWHVNIVELIIKIY